MGGLLFCVVCRKVIHKALSSFNHLIKFTTIVLFVDDSYENMK